MLERILEDFFETFDDLLDIKVFDPGFEFDFALVVILDLLLESAFKNIKIKIKLKMTKWIFRSLS